MKHKILFMAFITFAIGILCSCNREESVKQDRPVLYVVNGTGYAVDVYCDNHLVASAGAHNNSGTVRLTNVSINLPVYVEADFYDKKGNFVHSYEWTKYYFRWNKTYKMTLTNSSSSSIISEL